MKKICGLILLLILGVQTSLAQSDLVFMLNKEGKIIAVPKYVSFDFNIPKFSYQTYTPATTRLIDDILKAYEPFTPLTMDERPMDMQILSAAYDPFYNVYTPMLKKVSPMAFDFVETEFVPLNENLTVAVTGSQYTWPGAGGITTIAPALRWQDGPWGINGGVFAGRYYTPFNISPDYVTGGYMETSFQATDWLKVNAWGRYANYFGDERKNPHMTMNPFYYHNTVGASLEFKIKENFSMGAGLQYEFNPMRRKWERQLLIFPVFH